MDGYAHQLRELFELAGIPVVTDEVVRRLVEDGKRLLEQERTKRKLP